MADFYSDENFPLEVVEHLRTFGHDVLTAFEDGRANRRVPDDAVLAQATELGRAVLTRDRDFLRLHRRMVGHAGIIACTEDPDLERQAQHIHTATLPPVRLTGQLIRIYRGS